MVFVPLLRSAVPGPAANRFRFCIRRDGEPATHVRRRARSVKRKFAAAASARRAERRMNFMVFVPSLRSSVPFPAANRFRFGIRRDGESATHVMRRVRPVKLKFSNAPNGTIRPAAARSAQDSVTASTRTGAPARPTSVRSAASARAGASCADAPTESRRTCPVGDGVICGRRPSRRRPKLGGPACPPIARQTNRAGAHIASRESVSSAP